MVEGINRIVPDARGVLIPICVDTRDLRFDESARDGLRRQFNWDNRSIVAYQGSLGLLNRNISNIVEYIGFIREICSNAYFLILTPKDNHRAVAYLMGEHGIPSSQFLVIEPASGELHRWLSAADVGIHAMSAGPDSQTRLGVKVVEYLSCGLPVLVNANVGAAASLIDTHHVGAVIDLEKRVESQISIDRLFSQSHSLRQQCRKVAEDLFSVEVCASKYIDLYKELGNR
jgi:glycosyltransferase involved in cell wall biosynthesis